ncbi:MAG TPA: prepilin-type N-terminal cleavage/methylation domain-containing protein [Burkholderiaceae bacterium]|nr:prepilin-type N-terminal cleavage/methylation domain-containing protein [Burkholderiaceae bacterium]
MLNAARVKQRRQAGLSMVELMVGVAVGLFVVAGATVAVSNQLGDNRRLMLETQIQQDLRAAADVIARDIRRSGYWASAQDGVWHPAAAGVTINPYTALQPAASGVVASTVTFSYSRGAPANESAGFRLGNSGAIEMLTGGAWQALTDASTLRVTDFRVTLSSQDLPLSCFNPCPPGAPACPPTQSVRDIKVEILGTAVHDPSLQRSARSNVRVRNDVVNGACPA